MNIVNILEGLEKLIVELLTWIVTIPRTLRMILENPGAVPAFVDQELAKERGRFENHVSPVLLFLACSAVLYFLVTHVVEGDGALADRAKHFTDAFKGADASVVAMAFLVLPLFLGVVTHATLATEFTGQWIRRVLYIQCCYCAPLTLAVFSLSLSPSDTATASTTRAIAGDVVVYLFLAIIVWFLAAEVQLIRRERGFGFVGAAFTLVVALISLLLAFTFVVSTFGEPSDGPIDRQFGTNEELHDYALPRDGSYAVVVVAEEGEPARYRVALSRLVTGGEGVECADAGMGVTPVSGGTLEYGGVAEGAFAADGTARLTFDGSAGDRIHLSLNAAEGEEAKADWKLDLLDVESGESLVPDAVAAESEALREYLPYLFAAVYIALIGWAVMKGIWVATADSLGARVGVLALLAFLGLGMVLSVVEGVKQGTGDQAVLCESPAGPRVNAGGG